MRKIKKNDLVVVIKGKDKGKQGKILKVIPAENLVIVEGLGLVKKHVKPNPQKNQAGGIVEKESPIAISNVALVNHVTKKPDKVGIKILEDGKKVRYFKSNQELVDV